MLKGYKFALVAVAALLGTFFSGSALASLEPNWVTPTKVTKEITNPDGSKSNAAVSEPDIDKDGKGDYIAVTNLVDIVFNESGEILGWYPKLVKGTDNKNNYGPLSTLVMKNARSSVVLTNDGKPLGTPSNVVPPKLEINGDQNNRELRATFQYNASGSSVTKIYNLKARELTLNLDLKVTGLSNYQIEFVGLGDGKPLMKALESGASAPLEVGETASSGEVKNAVYASMQCCRSFFGSQGQSIIVRNQDLKSTLPVKLGLRTQSRKTDKGTENFDVSTITIGLTGTQNKLGVYGGFDELIRFNQEGYYALPGLFKPNIFGQISLVLVKILEFLNSYTHSWGLAIIAFTLLLRLALWPLLQTQFRSTAEMQAIQPQVKELQAKYKENPQKQQEELMKLYKEHGTNPLSGCLPILLQMPVLVVLWRVFQNIEFNQGFLWLRDLSLPDPFFILPVLYVVVNIGQLWISTRNTPEMFKQQLVMQFIFVYIVLSFPAGVTLYWVLSTAIAIAQQWFITNKINAEMALKGKIVKVAAK
jgi:YidC/Oxa1 family membrane protein insertase